jgi:hypothetical protein
VLPLLTILLITPLTNLELIWGLSKDNSWVCCRRIPVKWNGKKGFIYTTEDNHEIPRNKSGVNEPDHCKEMTKSCQSTWKRVKQPGSGKSVLPGSSLCIQLVLWKLAGCCSRIAAWPSVIRTSPQQGHKRHAYHTSSAVLIQAEGSRGNLGISLKTVRPLWGLLGRPLSLVTLIGCTCLFLLDFLPFPDVPPWHLLAMEPPLLPCAVWYGRCGIWSF